MPHEPSLVALQALAVQAVRRGGAHALANKHRRNEIHEALDHDVKLELDLECQRIIETIIGNAFPTHRILGEEDTGATVTGTADYQWIIDPIDGTVNFSHDQLIWCCSVAVRRGETVLAGAVYAPELDLLFEASAESPALCNGTPIYPSTTSELPK